MKKTIFFFAIALAAFSLQLKAQTQTQGDITLTQMPQFTHDPNGCWSYGQMPYTVMIANSFLGDSVKVINTTYGTLDDTASNYTGQNPWILTLFIQAPYFYPDVNMNNQPGNVILPGPTTKIINVHSHTALDTMKNISNFITGYVSNPCQYGDVSGKVYVDGNSNCVFDGTDVALQSISVSGMANLTAPSTSTTASASGYTDGAGAYSMKIQQSYMTDYVVQIPSNYQFIFPSTFCSPVIYTNTTLPQANVDFSLQCTSNIDVQCYASSSGAVRPNHSFFMFPSVSNTGCSAASGLLKLVLDNRVVYNAGLSTNPANTVSGDTLIWNYNNLTNLTNNGYWNSFYAGVHLTPIVSVNIGDTLCFRVMTNIPTNDIDAGNNDYSICLPVVNSYDPNAKEVFPKGSGANGNISLTTTDLDYTIHFQNTGTAIAYNVSIIDTLDSDIIPNSLVITCTSHNVSPEWLAPGIVRFDFNNINLPDSTSSSLGSRGAISFTIKLHSGLPAGTQIKNKANIYFDSNSPVPTNTTTNTLFNFLGVDDLKSTAGSLKVYPNPSNGKFTLELNGMSNQTESLEIYNMFGEKVYSTSGLRLQSSYALDLSSYSKGVYFVRINDGKKNYTDKIVIQ